VWASPEQRQGKQEVAGGLGELGDLGSHLLNLYYRANPGFWHSDADSSSPQVPQQEACKQTPQGTQPACRGSVPQCCGLSGCLVPTHSSHMAPHVTTVPSRTPCWHLGQSPRPPLSSPVQSVGEAHGTEGAATPECHGSSGRCPWVYRREPRLLGPPSTLPTACSPLLPVRLGWPRLPERAHCRRRQGHRSH